MNKSKIEELKAKVEAAQAAQKVELAEKVEIAKLEAKLVMATNTSVIDARARQEAKAQQTQRLQSLVNECEAMVESVPVFNEKTRSNRVWSGTRKFNYGSQINLMYQLATGIMYSCAEHKELLLSYTGMNMELVEEMVESFGTPSYYSRNNHSIEEPKPYNVERVNDAVNVMQATLDVVVDTSALTDNNFSKEFERAESMASKNYADAIEALKEADFVV